MLRFKKLLQKFALASLMYLKVRIFYGYLVYYLSNLS